VSLETTYFIAQIIAALAIVGSLLFVGLQMRLATKERYEARAIARGDRARSLYDNIISSEILARLVYAKDVQFKDLTQEEFAILDSFFRKVLVGYHLAFREIKGGHIDPSGQAGFFTSIKRNAQSPLWREWWRTARNQYGEDFALYIDSLIKEVVPEQQGGSDVA